MHVEESGCQVEGFYKNEKKMTPFLQKRVEKMSVLTKKMKRKRKFYDKGNLKIYFSRKTETNSGYWLKFSVFPKVTKKSEKKLFKQKHCYRETKKFTIYENSLPVNSNVYL